MLWNCVENYIKNFKACWKPFKSLGVLKHSFQNALQISTRSEICNMHYRFQNRNFQNAFPRCFQHISNIKIHLWYEPCWKLCWGPCQIFESVLKTILKISRLGSYFRKRHDVTVTWPFENIFHRTNTVKIYTDIMDKDNGMFWSCMCSLIKILWVLKEKISLNCWQL